MTRGDRRRSTTIHENHKAVVAAFYNRCLSDGEVGAVAALIAPDFVDQSYGLAGIAEVERFVAERRKHWPTLTYTVEDIIAEGDRVAVRWTGRGTDHTGRNASWTGMGFYRIRDGRIAEHWVSEDSLGLAQQLARLHNGA